MYANLKPCRDFLVLKGGLGSGSQELPVYARICVFQYLGTHFGIHKMPQNQIQAYSDLYWGPPNYGPPDDVPSFATP